MRKVLIGLAVSLLLTASIGAATAQAERVDAPCAGYAVDVRQQADGYDVLLTVPLPPTGFRGVYLEVDGQSLTWPEGDEHNVFRVPFTVSDIGSEHHYYGSSWTRGVGGLVVYACTDIGAFEVNL